MGGKEGGDEGEGRNEERERKEEGGRKIRSGGQGVNSVFLYSTTLTLLPLICTIT